MDTILKQIGRYNSAIMNDKEFKKSTKEYKMKTGVKPKEEPTLFDDTHQRIRPLWLESKKNEPVEVDQSELKGKDLLKRVYQGGAKVKPKEILDKVLKSDTKIIKHLDEHVKEGNYDQKDIKQAKMLRNQIKEIAETKLTPAIRLPKSNPLWKYSNPNIAQNQATRLLGKDAILYKSERKDKKYQILDPEGNWVSFGQMGYEDFTKHRDQKRRENYLNRASKIKGEWRQNEYSPNALAMRILW